MAIDFFDQYGEHIRDLNLEQILFFSHTKNAWLREHASHLAKLSSDQFDLFQWLAEDYLTEEASINLLTNHANLLTIYDVDQIATIFSSEKLMRYIDDLSTADQVCSQETLEFLDTQTQEDLDEAIFRLGTVAELLNAAEHLYWETPSDDVESKRGFSFSEIMQQASLASQEDPLADETLKASLMCCDDVSEWLKKNNLGSVGIIEFLHTQSRKFQFNFISFFESQIGEDPGGIDMCDGHSDQVHFPYQGPAAEALIKIVVEESKDTDCPYFDLGAFKGFGILFRPFADTECDDTSSEDESEDDAYGRYSPFGDSGHRFSIWSMSRTGMTQWNI